MDRDQLIAEIKKQLQEELKDYTKTLRDKIPDQQKAQAMEIKNEVTDFVKQNPVASLALAVFAGFVMGRLLYKRSDD